MAGTESHDVGTAAAWLPAWDGAAYAANTEHHRRYDAEFVATLPVSPADRVLDLGCGSGDFTATVAALVPEGQAVGLDAQASMLIEATGRALPNQSFVEGPVQALDALLPDGGQFDVIYSRSALHWVPAADHPGVLASCRRLLRPGGWLRIECGGGDNVREIVAFLGDIAADVLGPSTPRCPWTFLGAGAYLDLLLDAGFSVDEGFVRNPAQRRSFDRDSMVRWLLSQAVQAYDDGADRDRRDAFRATVLERVDELRRTDGSYDLTFVRLDVLAATP